MLGVWTRRWLTTLGLVFLLGGLSWAQWLTPQKPGDEDAAVALAGLAPAHSQSVAAWSLKGHLDYRAITRDLRALFAEFPGDAQEELTQWESELGVSFEEWLGLFTGAGYVAHLSKSDEGPDFPFVLVLQLERPGPFAAWLREFSEGKLEFKQQADALVAELGEDETLLGISGEWFFYASDPQTSTFALAALRGESNGIGDRSDFQGALKTLGVNRSGALFYTTADSFRDTLTAASGLDQDHPAMDQLGFWKFGILSIDFSTQTTDGLLGYSSADTALMKALRSPGRLDGSMLSEFPNEVRTFASADLGWLGHLVMVFADEVPDFGGLLGMGMAQVKSYGDIGIAFTGPAQVGTNAFDLMGPAMAEEMVRSAAGAKRYECGANIEELMEAVASHVQTSGKLPSSLADFGSPICPEAGRSTYRLVAAEGDEFRIWCAGQNHRYLLPDYPRMSSVAGHEDGFSEEPYKDSEEPSAFGSLAVANVGEVHKILSKLVAENKVDPTDACVSNLKNFATALEMYSTDWSGNYPENSSFLTPNYLRTLPVCPQSEEDTYSATYELYDSGKAYKFHCKSNHPGYSPNHPRYDFEAGVVRGPVKEVAQAKPLPAPAPGETRLYEIHDGPTGKLQGSVLNFAYGAQAETYLNSGGGSVEDSPLVRQALAWGGDSIIYLDQVDLEGLYQFWVNYEGLDGAEKAAQQLARTLHQTTGELRGVNCLKVTDEGLRYRGQGFSSAPLWLAGGVGAGFFMFTGSSKEPLNEESSSEDSYY